MTATDVFPADKALKAGGRGEFALSGLGSFKLGVLPEGLQQLTSYKLALHVLVTFTEEIFPIYKHISYFILNSRDIRNRKLWSYAATHPLHIH